MLDVLPAGRLLGVFIYVGRRYRNVFVDAFVEADADPFVNRKELIPAKPQAADEKERKVFVFLAFRVLFLDQGYVYRGFAPYLEVTFACGRLCRSRCCGNS